MQGGGQVDPDLSAQAVWEEIDSVNKTAESGTPSELKSALSDFRDAWSLVAQSDDEEVIEKSHYGGRDLLELADNLDNLAANVDQGFVDLESDEDRDRIYSASTDPTGGDIAKGVANRAETKKMTKELDDVRSLLGSGSIRGQPSVVKEAKQRAAELESKLAEPGRAGGFPTPRDSDQGGGEDGAQDAHIKKQEDAFSDWADGGPWNAELLGPTEGEPSLMDPVSRKDAIDAASEGLGGERKAPDDERSGPQKRCPKGSRKDDSGTCQKYSEADATDPAPKKKTLRERLGAKKKCDGDCPHDDNDGRQAKQFKAPPGREAQVKALKKEDVKNPYAVAWSSYDAKNAESYAPICFSDNQLPGGDFDAVQNDDGTWNIGIDKDIPIMGTVHEVGVKGNEKPIGIKWLRAALRKHRDLEEQPGGAYYAPVHLRHHSENPDQDETVPAGFLRLNRIAPAFDGGDNKAAIFASLYNVPDEIYQQIKAKKWAFRSVEVASWDKPQISSLSLLNTEAPFFKYGLTTIGKETPAQAVEIIPIEAAAPALALCESGAGGSILFNFSEARRMAEEKIKEELEIEEELDLNDEDVDVDVDVDEEEDDAVTLSEVAGMMRELMRRLDDEEEEIIDDTHEEVRDKRNEDVPVDIAASEGKMAAMLSELSGRVSGIESNQRKGRQRQALASYVEKSLGKLSGYNLPESLGDTMTKMAQTAGGNYKKLLDQFVSTFKATASRDEDLATLDDFEQSISIGQGDEALAKFAQKGEASLTNARKHLRTFKSLQDKGVRFADGVDDPANFIDILTNDTNTEN